MRLFAARFSLLLVLGVLCPRLHAIDRYGLDLKGQPVHQLAGPGVHLVVLIFAASDCPIANRYVPEIARLNREFALHGTRIWWVFPNPEDTAAVVAKHNHEFGIGEATVLDTRQTLVGLAHASVTPEAALFKVEGTELREIYHGRIDDRYLAIGQERPQPQHHDLEDAIAAALAGKPIPSAKGPAVGCSIVYLQK
jgi:hypothetical protein